MKKNVGRTDKMIRLGLAVIVLGLVGSHKLPGAGETIAMIAGILLLATGFIGFCPLYRLLGISTNKPEADFKRLVVQGAVIVDVRTPSEYAMGHVPGSINIPVARLTQSIASLNGKNVITCCASGSRSAMAKSMLLKTGITAYNGGGWRDLSAVLG